MATATVELQQAIKEARQRYAEAEDLHDHPLATEPVERENQRDRLMGPLSALDEQITALEAVHDEKNAAQVVVDDVTPEESAQIDDALRALQVVIRRTETFEKNLALVTAVLGAVTTITSAGKRGHAAGATIAPPAVPPAAGREVRPTSIVAAVTSKPRYVCWAPHHEDLSNRVEAALATGPTSTAAVTGTARITVTCSEGHMNVFTIR